MGNNKILKDELDTIITSYIMNGSSVTKVAVIVGKTDRTIQLRWKKIVARLCCRSSEHAAGKIGSLCAKYNLKFPPSRKDLEKLNNI